MGSWLLLWVRTILIWRCQPAACRCPTRPHHRRITSKPREVRKAASGAGPPGAEVTDWAETTTLLSITIADKDTTFLEAQNRGIFTQTPSPEPILAAGAERENKTAQQILILKWARVKNMAQSPVLIRYARLSRTQLP